MNSPHTSTTQNICRIGLGLFMLLAGIGHLTFKRKEFQAQVPDWVPLNEDLVVIVSGVAEVALGGAMVFLPKHKVKTGIALAAFYVAVFPGNISQYLNGIDAFGLDTDQKRFARLFFQPVLIVWALWSTGVFQWMHQNRKKSRSLLS
ncbi:hypothetical protein GXP67_23630 [Rhodocytophaga rosea]|uniref:DoxX family membrane protein n=1 Tax=Rhodocytophaga rosea TaxID=2704465 RepID=A0A6C0GN00_9BACT|nr:hypothetical protein [Rhodocytophaga rosea]QHT69418.1 hypothetical protein GXP67_23630 [Rhodocytophaga rosea]